jgi:Xaa-Pro aminopeptidase
MHLSILSQAAAALHPDFNNAVALQCPSRHAIMAAVSARSIPAGETHAPDAALVDRLRDALARRGLRQALPQAGLERAHHTGHGIGAAWSEEPRIVPYDDMQIEEDMVLAVGPAIYRPGFGVRLEDVFVVRANGNQLLTRSEHRL